MNISLNGLFASCYNIIKDTFSNLSPLQKKVAVVAVACFSCATVVACIYRFYYFQARPVFARQSEEEDGNIFSPPQKEVQQSVNKTETSKKSPQHSVQPSETKLKDKNAQIKEIAQRTILEADRKQAEKIKNLVSPQVNPSLNKLPSISEQDVKSSAEESSTESSSTEGLPAEESSTTEESTEAEEIGIEKIEKSLKKNGTFACLQQDREKPKGFSVKMEICLHEYYKRPVLVNKETGEINYRKIPKIDILLNKEEIKYPRVGVSSCQGKRATMEDATDVAQISLFIKEKIYRAYTFAVFDGHGGSKEGNKTVSYTRENFGLYLQEALEQYNEEGLTDVGIWIALKICFKNLDEDVCRIFEDGTTATVAMILENKIWVANVGDSRTILVKEGRVTQASEDAKPQIERYKKKIEKLGGRVEFIGNAYRVNGNLATARAIGDRNIVGKNGKCCISPSPKITCYSLKDFEGGYIVAACDGLYDVATTNEVGQAIVDMASQKLSTDQMSQQLVCAALNRGSTDNVSVVVVGL